MKFVFTFPMPSINWIFFCTLYLAFYHTHQILCSSELDSSISSETNIESVAPPNVETSVIVMACVVSVIVTVGIVGNLLVICVLTCSKTRLVYETFCVGLAVTDLTYLTLTSPITVMQYFMRSWIFGLFWCKVFNFIVQVTVFSSAFMLLGLTTSRFLAVVLPWQNLKVTEIQAKLLCVGAWLVGIIFALPIIIFQVLVPIPLDDEDNLTPNQTHIESNLELTTTMTTATLQTPVYSQDTEYLCREQFPSQTSRTGYQLFVLLSTYVLPFACILVMNSCIVFKLRQKNMIEKAQKQRQNANPMVSNDIPNKSRCFLFKKIKIPNGFSETNVPMVRHLGPGRPNTDDTNSDNRTEPNCTQIQDSTRSPIVMDTITSTNTNTTNLTKTNRRIRKKQQRSKATKLVVLVTTLWGVCWLPTHIINSWFFFDEASFPFVPAMRIAKLISQTLSISASCVNPIVYSSLTGTFKSALSHRLLKWKRSRSDRIRTESFYLD